ncbi:MAG: hypothetical protein ABH824_05055 [Nanoarchaeota archaeon]|nr:hypothetical protein [Nanoarchaeota archaeon]MBU1632466.1 hypothetical protein [Nanoarchaeota archaeon]MBU1876461.1 hypothetical protein [Nanoarchaeota archaeon]
MVLIDFSLLNIAKANLSFSDAILSLIPLFLFILGMVVYAIFVFKFYRFVARRDIFKLNLKKHSKSFRGFLENFFHLIFYTFEYLFLFPIFTFFWFIVLAIIIMLLSETQAVSNILLVAMALVGSVRATAYYNEDLSKDLAKMLPFALLGIFLLDISNFSYYNSWLMIRQLPDLWQTIIYYFIFIVALELILRIAYLLINPLLSSKDIPSEEAETRIFPKKIYKSKRNEEEINGR